MNYDETELRGDLCARRWGKKSISSKRSHPKNSFDSDDTVTVTVNTIFSIFKIHLVSRHTIQHCANWQLWCLKTDCVETR